MCHFMPSAGSCKRKCRWYGCVHLHVDKHMSNNNRFVILIVESYSVTALIGGWFVHQPHKQPAVQRHQRTRSRLLHCTRQRDVVAKRYNPPGVVRLLWIGLDAQADAWALEVHLDFVKVGAWQRAQHFVAWWVALPQDPVSWTHSNWMLWSTAEWGHDTMECAHRASCNTCALDFAAQTNRLGQLQHS